MADDSLNIIQFTDMHLFSDKKKTLLGVNTRESFQAVIDLAKAEEKKIDLILLTGDLTQDTSKRAYIRVAEMLQPFGDVPIYWVPGNHDDRKIMSQVYPRGQILNNKLVILNSWQIILLNTQKTGLVEGYLDGIQLNFLEECLQRNPDKNALILFHHQPLPIGSKWLDRLGIINAEEFWQLIATYPNVKSVLFGHIHQEFEKLYRGVSCYGSPSTCIQFKRLQDIFGLEEFPPGYRVLRLYNDGRIETEVKRVANYIGKFECDAQGY